MQQLEFFDIINPCKNICTSNSKGYCCGCWRTRDERMLWKTLSNEDKNNILRLCAIRKRRDLLQRYKTAMAQQIQPISSQLNLFTDEDENSS